jgi:hypothetical protein
MPESDNLPPPEQLQFRRAQHEVDPSARVCVMCKQNIAGDFFQANGNTLCATCAPVLASRQQGPPPASLLPALLYGGAAAIGGAIIYSIVLSMGVELALIAILVAYMVGKAIRYASHGLGGQPQQILAVALTYFAITASYLAVNLYHSKGALPPISFMLEVIVGAPILLLIYGGSKGSALLSVLIIGIGLRQAWMLTKRPEIIITGPFSPN